MAYDEGLAHRVRATLADQPAVVEKKMFGGLTFMLQGNMCCGIMKDGLMVRVGPEHYVDALGQPHARPMLFTGKPMKGIVLVGRKAVQQRLICRRGCNGALLLRVRYRRSEHHEPSLRTKSEEDR